MRTVGAALFLFHLLPAVLAAQKYYQWNVAKGLKFIGPGVQAPVITINPPGPIEVFVNDVINIQVTNVDIDEGITLHAHGLHQLNNNQYDGPEGITQCPIMKTKTFTYIWTADTAGTFWIHSHKSGQYPYGLRTPLIVKDANDPAYYGYDANNDVTLDMTDFWVDMAAADVEYNQNRCNLSSGNGYLTPEPDYAFFLDSPIQTVDLTSAPHTPPTAGTGIRIRLINMSAYNTFIIFSSDPNMKFRVIEVDGVALEAPPSDATQGRWATSLEIYPGQRYSILIKSSSWTNFKLYGVIDANHYAGSSCSSSKGNALMATANFKVQPGINTYSSVTFTTPIPECPDSSRPCFYTQPANGRIELNNMPVYANALQNGRVNDGWYWADFKPKTQVPRIRWNDANSVLVTIDLKADANGKANMNDVHFTLPSLPLMVDNLVNGNSYFKENVWWVNQNTQVFLVVRSHIGSHPFHLHGHDFQVLYHMTESEPGATEPPNIDEGKLKRNEYNQPDYPISRDTIVIPSKTYSLIAFTANNPGAWFMHCHNDFHAQAGSAMAGAFIVVPNAGSTWHKAAAGATIKTQCGLPTAKLFRA